MRVHYLIFTPRPPPVDFLGQKRIGFLAVESESRLHLPPVVGFLGQPPYVGFLPYLAFASMSSQNLAMPIFSDGVSDLRS